MATAAPATGMAPSSPEDLFSLHNRTIIITGGLGSVGAALSKTLSHYGADIILMDLAPEANIPTSSPQIHYIPCDVTSPQSVTAAFAQAESLSKFPIRGLVTCTGISGRCPATSYPISDFRKIMEVNVTGTFLCAQAVARIMHKQNSPGSIVMFASMSGTNVNRGVDTAAYNTSKSAVLQLARNLAAEWGNDGVHPPIRVNTLSPGYIDTPLTTPTLEAFPELQKLWPEGNMLGRISTVAEHQSSVVFLLSDGSSYVTAADLRADAGHCAW